MSIVNVEALTQNGAVLWWPGTYAESGAYDDGGNKRGFMILPDGVTVTPSGTFTTQKMRDGRNIWKFNGGTTYILVTDHDSWALVDNWTIVFWIKFNTILSSRQYGTVLTHQQDGSNFDQFAMFYNNSGTHQFFTRLYRSSDLLNLVVNTGTPVTGEWYCYTIVCTEGSVSIYKNLTLLNNASISGTVTNITGSLFISYSGSNTYGNIKDLMIFKGKALNQDQIAAITAETFIY